ncbi:hypothetical protein HYFRA_00000694 [Hymenoscyphus fraxineus]|uniref:Uncharacterized protein n=1 Tax=Hymenoscyphus fraxineus TaxID=746836 RepID=A0A9N9L6B3_9HELO|nr:hypothetical protein HYFRA_00000694 [Hymenoscyphus fraxineus]
MGDPHAPPPASDAPVKASTAPTAPTASTATSTALDPTSTQSNNAKPGTKKNISPGAVAGVGIGSFIIGLMVAGLVVFLLMSFKNKRQRRGYPKHHSGPDESPYTSPRRHSTRGNKVNRAATNVDRLLPQPAEDGAIIGGLSKIRDGIKNHTQNYYHNSPVSSQVVNEANLVELSSATGMATASLKQLLLNPLTRTPAIKVFLAQLVLSRCEGRTDGQDSFLPQEISGLSTPGNATELALFSKWKTISGALLQRQYSQKPEENDPRVVAITQALALAELVLHPFINRDVDVEARRRNLMGISKRAAQFAFLLFSQPGMFQFDYAERRSGRSDSMVVFPALVQTVSDEAEKLTIPRVLREKEMISGSGK